MSGTLSAHRSGYWHRWLSPAQAAGDRTAHTFAFTIDVPLIVAPVKDFAITLGPLFDVSFAGKQTRSGPTGDVDTDTSFTNFGLSADIVGFL